jgi:hypothetical protein
LQLQACKPKSSVFSLPYKITEVTTIQTRSGFPNFHSGSILCSGESFGTQITPTIHGWD